MLKNSTEYILLSIVNIGNNSTYQEHKIHFFNKCCLHSNTKISFNNLTKGVISVTNSNSYLN